MSVYVTIDLDSLMCKLSDKELYDFMLETFRDRVPDESHVNLIAEMFKVMFDSDKKEALVAMLKDMGLSMDSYKNEMNGIYSTSVCEETIDEAPMAYKPTEEIVELIKPTVDVIDVIKPIYNFKAKSL